MREYVSSFPLNYPKDTPRLIFQKRKKSFENKGDLSLMAVVASGQPIDKTETSAIGFCMKNNTNEFELSLESIDSSVIDGRSITIKTKWDGKKTGTLKVTPVRAIGNIVTVEVFYDATEVPGESPKLKSFFLNQSELDDYLARPSKYIYTLKESQLQQV